MKRLMRVFQSQGVRQSAFLAVGNLGATGFSAISLIILSRYLGPQSFGGFSVAFSLTQIIAKVGDFGFNLSLQRLVAQQYLQHEKDAAIAIQQVARIKLIASLTSIVLGIIAGPLLASYVFHVSNPTLIILGVSLASIIVGYEYLLAVVQAVAKFTQAVFMNAAQALIKCSMAIFSFFVLPANAIVAYLWYGLAPLAGIMVGIVTLKRYFRSLPHNPKMWSELIRVARFGAINVMALAIVDNIDVLMVNSSLNEYETGLYSAASRVALMIGMVGVSFGTVFNTRVAQYRNQRDLSAFMSKAAVLALASLAVIPLLAFLAKPLLIVTAGNQFTGAVTTLIYLIAAACVYMAVIPYVAIFYSVDYPAYFAISGVIQMIVLIASNLLLIPKLGIEGAAIAKLMARTSVALYTLITAYIYAARQYRVKRPTVQDLLGLIHA